MTSDSAYRPIALEFEHLSADEQRSRLAAFQSRILKRRTVRHYSSEPVPDDLIDTAIAVAGSAPSGANLQPWRFVVVRDPEVKRQIRQAAEDEERAFYDRRAPGDWLSALAPLGTDWTKEFLETAPCLIVVFRVDYAVEPDDEGGERHIKHYSDHRLRPGAGLVSRTIMEVATPASASREASYDLSSPG